MPSQDDEIWRFSDAAVTGRLGTFRTESPRRR
jgi:hypothetical protein